MGKGQEEERVKRYTAVEARENVNKTREVKKKGPFKIKEVVIVKVPAEELEIYPELHAIMDEI